MRQNWSRRLLPIMVPMALIATASVLRAADTPADITSKPLVLHTRSFVPLDESLTGRFAKLESIVKWDPQQTAMIVCDMWDQHWCRGAARRVEELAGPMNELIREARKRGVFIIHAPSTTVKFYEGTLPRKRAQQAKMVPTSTPLASVERWGTAWCYPNENHEPPIPIDDTDMGCDCVEKCQIVPPWTRQIKTIEIADQDAITDNGQETFNLLAERGIDQVIIMGVHLNMCVLGRPFAIRQLVAQGKKVLLIRDMTDTMYNSKMKPFVDHFSGTELMVNHVEKYWCPTIDSTDFMGGNPFRFHEDTRTASESNR
ncbi:isochorismatase family protein [Schlesneria paludicola]|uniref:isochorismatase family protein n=1 Tax=Schlesneria paludicola TaxID=360056 RepID=UPI00029A9814|nr:isochorismatase family protein [Schlesneria paludicola]